MSAFGTDMPTHSLNVRYQGKSGRDADVAGCRLMTKADMTLRRSPPLAANVTSPDLCELEAAMASKAELYAKKKWTKALESSDVGRQLLFYRRTEAAGRAR